MSRAKRYQGVFGPSPLDVYVAHWLNYGVHLPMGEELDEWTVDRVLAFREMVRREWDLTAHWLNFAEPRYAAKWRMWLRPRVEAFLRGEPKPKPLPEWTKRPPWRPGACL